MKKIIKLLFILICSSSFQVSNAQDFNFVVNDSHISAIPGSGLDIKVRLDFEGSVLHPVHFSAEMPKGIKAIFQPDSVMTEKPIILSVIVEDTNLKGKSRDIKLIASDGTFKQEKWLHLQIPDDIYIFSDLASLYRDSALHYLYQKYPEILIAYGDFCKYPYDGFWPFPHILVVSNYNFLFDNWRINVLWHNMIYPYNWEKVYIFNEELNFCKGIKIDSVGKCSEIPCEKRYYFQTNEPTVIPDNGGFKSYDQIIVYPIPASNEVFYQCISTSIQKIKSVRIFDQQGKCISSKETDEDRGMLDISSLPAGVYLLFFDLGSSQIRKKLVVY
jgi:hypothetical protein